MALTLTFQVHLGSFVLMELDYQYMISYFGLIVTHSLIRLLCNYKHAKSEYPCNVAADFLLVYDSKHLSISRDVAVICTWTVS